jgi:succinate dehydrogenase/fumarate reductase flavoprotein subunit
METLAKPEDVDLSSARLALIHDALKVQVDAGQIPGAIVLVARDGKVVHFEAQGVAGAAGGSGRYFGSAE